MLERQPPGGQENCRRGDQGARTSAVAYRCLPDARTGAGLWPVRRSPCHCRCLLRHRRRSAGLGGAVRLGALARLPGEASLHGAFCLLALGLLAFARKGGLFSAYALELGGAPGRAFGFFGLLALGLLDALAFGLLGTLAFGLGAALGFCPAFGLDSGQTFGLGDKPAVGFFGLLAFGWVGSGFLSWSGGAARLQFDVVYELTCRSP